MMTSPYECNDNELDVIFSTNHLNFWALKCLYPFNGYWDSQLILWSQDPLISYFYEWQLLTPQGRRLPSDKVSTHRFFIFSRQRLGGGKQKAIESFRGTSQRYTRKSGLSEASVLPSSINLPESGGEGGACRDINSETDSDHFTYSYTYIRVKIAP